MTTADTKHRILALSIILALFASPVGIRAQDDSGDEQRRTGLYKILAGAGLAVTGALLAAASSESATITLFDGSTTKISARSTTGLVMGLTLAGGGGFLLWDGNKDRQEASKPSSSVRFRTTVGGAKVVFARVW